MPNQSYVLYCYKLPAGTEYMYAMTISVPSVTTNVTPILHSTVAELQQSLTILGLTADQQTAAVNANTMYILSGLSVSDYTAKNFGIQLHDGDMPDEYNEITFTKCSAGGSLQVSIVMNDQIMPAPTVGCFDWNTVSQCLLTSGVFTQPQIDAVETEVNSTGTSTQNWRGVSTGIIQCMK
jgi:hypothetical protein